MWLFTFCDIYIYQKEPLTLFSTLQVYCIRISLLRVMCMIAYVIGNDSIIKELPI